MGSVANSIMGQNHSLLETGILLSDAHLLSLHTYSLLIATN